MNKELLAVAEWAVYALEHGSHIEVHWLNTVAKEKHAWAKKVIAEASRPEVGLGELIPATVNGEPGRVAFFSSEAAAAHRLNLKRPDHPLLRELDLIIETAKSKTPCASHYECLLADVMGLRSKVAAE